MNRGKASLQRLLLCALAVQVMSACGPEAGFAAEGPEAFAQSAQGHEDKPTAGSVSIELVRADGAANDPAPVTALTVDTYGLILIDRTGSMTTLRTTGRTRCLDAVKHANTQLDILFNDPNKHVTKVAVWTFAGATVINRTSGYVDKATARTAINGLTTDTCTDNTPLADAICLAIEDLSLHAPSATSHLYVATDGGNNAGNTNHCHGPSGDISDVNTWQHKVWAKLQNSHVSTNPDDWGIDALTFAPQTVQPSATTTCSTDAQCDDAVFAAMANYSGGEYRRIKDADAAYPCPDAASCPAPQASSTGNQFTFSASNTASATSNTVNQSVYLLAGETIKLGTCGVAGASGTGDTYLRLYDPSGALAAFNDDACGGSLSNIAYTAPTSGTYLIRAGCYAGNACSGKVVYTISGSFSYRASNTNNATANTANRDVYLKPGQNIQLGTCGVTGAAGTGDTYLRLFNASSQVAANDDACSGILSNISYNVQAGVGGKEQIRAGCFGSTSCTGTVAYVITDHSP